MNTHDTSERTQRPQFWLRAMTRRQHELAHEKRRAWRAELDERARAGISDEDYTTTMRTLEAMARNLGWDESEHLPGGPRRFGHRHERPFGHRGFGPHGFRRGAARGTEDLPTTETPA